MCAQAGAPYRDALLPLPRFLTAGYNDTPTDMDLASGFRLTGFFLSRQTLIASKHPGMALWREKLFAWMMRNAATPMEFFRLPTNRVVELGSQVEI